MSNPVDRTLTRVANLLALLLKSRAPLTLEQIADQIAPSYPADEGARRTAFERDKRTLREQGVPIESVVLSGQEAGRSAYYVDRSKMELPDLGLSEDERAALRLAVAAIRLDVDWGESAVRKVDLQDVPAPTLGVAAALPASPHLPALTDAHLRSARVRFGYKGEPREVEPWGLLAREGWWYVVGRDVAKDAVRVYRLDRIEGEVRAGEPGAFVVPDGFDPAASFSADPRQLRLGPEDEPTAAEVWISPSRAATVVADLGEDAVLAREDDGAVVVRVPYAHRPAFLSWVLGLLDDAEVRSPADLRAEVIAVLERMAGVA